MRTILLKSQLFRSGLGALLVLASLLAMLPPLANAQDMQESNKAPITVETDTQPIPAGSSIVLRGTTVAIDVKKPVQLTVTWLRSLQNPPPPIPAPEPEKLTAPYREDGTYAVVHSVGREGRYRVDAVSPDGTGTASTEFSVTGFDGWSMDQAESIGRNLDLTSDLLDSLEAVVKEQPISPAQQDFAKRVPQLKQALAQRKAALADLKAALEVYSRIVKTSPATSPALQPVTRAFADYQRRSAEITPQIKKAIAENKAQNKVCDALIKVEEGFKLMSAMFNLAEVPIKILIAFAADFATSAASDKAPSECGGACKFAFTQVVKQHLWVRPDSFKASEWARTHHHYIKNLPGLATDLSGFATHALFDHYCERFEGPVKGKMKAQFFKDGEKWWQYTTEIAGVMTLVYRKGSDIKNGVAVAGHLVGTGTKFTVWEDALRVLKRKALAGAIVAGRTVPPVGFPFTDVEGALLVQAVPTGFFIPVEGELIGNKLKLKFGPSRTDFNETYTQARGRYVVGGVLSMGVLTFTSFEVGFDKARGIIDKATNAVSGPIEIPVVIGPKQMKAERVFKGERGKTLARGEYELKVTLCNPKC